MNTTKQQMTESIARETGITQHKVKAGINGFLEVVADFLKVGKRVELRKIGTFYTKPRKARPARNPRTGDVVMLPKRRVALFKFSPEMEVASEKR